MSNQPLTMNPDGTPKPDDMTGSDPNLTPESESDSPHEFDDPRQEAEHWKNKFSASSKGAQKLASQVKEFTTQNQNLQAQINNMSATLTMLQSRPAQPPVQQNTAPQPQLLTTEEERDWQDAIDNMDAARQLKYQKLYGERQNMQFLGTLAGMAQQSGAVNAVINQINAAPEVRDQAVANQLLMRAYQIESDPILSQTVGKGQWNVAGRIVNPFAVERALMEYRASVGAANRSGATAAAGSSYIAQPGTAPDASSPEGAGARTFNPGVHMRPTELSAIRKNAALRGLDAEAEIRKFWSDLPKGEREMRLARGGPGESGKTVEFRPNPKRKG